MKIKAEWTHDCGGKQDYDGSIVSVSTRYWRDYTAHAAIHLNMDEFPEYIELVERDFKGESEADVKRQVELWAQAEFEKIVKMIKAIYPVKELLEESKG